MRPLLIGEAPARTTPVDWPSFYGRERSGRMLWDLGFRVARHPEGVGNVDSINLLNEWPGRRWPAARAHDVAMSMKPALRKLDDVVLVGRNVANAFGALSWDWFEWFYLGEHGDGPRFAAMPHPSGLNRWWNSEVNRQRARIWAVDLVSRTSNVVRGFRMPRRPEW